MARAVRLKSESTRGKRISSDPQPSQRCHVVGLVIIGMCVMSALVAWYFKFRVGAVEENPTWMVWPLVSLRNIIHPEHEQPTLSSRISSWFYSMGMNAAQATETYTKAIKETQYITWMFSYFYIPYFLSVAIVSVCGLVCVCTLSIYFTKYRQKSKSSDTHRELMQRGSRQTVQLSTLGYHHHVWCTRLLALLFSLVLLALVISLPWEFVRLYQNAVSKKAAVTIGGMPAECHPHTMSLWQTMTSWLRWHFSWTEDPCEVYHRAVLVDPLWEVTPMMVISSALTRCVTQPLHTFSGGVGDALRAFLASVPSPWQPLVLGVVCLLVIILIIMSCGYRIHVPLLLNLEPHKPDLRASTNQLRQSTPKRNVSQRAVKHLPDDSY